MTTIKAGDAEIRRVEEMTISSSMALLTQDQALIDANKDWLLPSFMGADGKRDFVFQSWILLIDSKVFVIDPCNGNDRPHMLPLFNRLKTPYIERFCATGIRPEEVDYVFCTHLHHDHCGWSTQLRDGSFVPTFPNARYVYVRREFDRWDPRRPDYNPIDYNVGVFEHSVLPIMEAGLAELVKDVHRLSDSVEIEPAYGHTLGHSMLRVSSQSESVYFTGDVFHHPLQILYPQLHLPGCDNLAMAIETRRRVANLCAESGALIVPAHFAKAHAGYARKLGGALIFEPITGAEVLAPREQSNVSHRQ
jgi:glyoxylase-like metal-dependent hydrolase (beta-lactamase superfamily II)